MLLKHRTRKKMVASFSFMLIVWVLSIIGRYDHNGTYSIKICFCFWQWCQVSGHGIEYGKTLRKSSFHSSRNNEIFLPKNISILTFVCILLYIYCVYHQDMVLLLCNFPTFASTEHSTLTQNIVTEYASVIILGIVDKIKTSSLQCSYSDTVLHVHLVSLLRTHIFIKL